MNAADAGELAYVYWKAGDGLRCEAAHPHVGWRCARLPDHDDDQCAAITDTGRVVRFPFAPLPDEVRAALVRVRAVEEAPF